MQLNLFLLAHLFKDEDRWISLRSETIIENLRPAFSHGIYLFIVKQPPSIDTGRAHSRPAFLANVNVVVVMTEHNHGSELVRLCICFLDFVEFLQLDSLRYGQEELEDRLA